METPKILFIVINYFNEIEVSNFVSHLTKQQFNNYHLLIVNNGSENDKALKQLVEKYNSVTLVQPNDNLGYLGGARFALTYWINQHKELPEYLILCNTDIAFSDTDFFNLLMNENADVIGPSIISSKTGVNQNPYYKNRISINKLQLLNLVYSFYPIYFIYQSASLLKMFFKNIFSSKQGNIKQEVYAVHGSFMIFKTSFFNKGGNFNYESFLYGEEIFIAEISRQNSMIVNYNPALKIIHHEHSTTGTFKKPQHIKFMKQSISYLLKSFFRRW